jgi:hypothetical protein
MRTAGRQTREELSPSVAPPRSADEFGLAELQGLLYWLITAPAGVEEAAGCERALQDLGLDAVISGNSRLSASDRVRTYANAYFYRLLDIFKEEFSCTYTVVGDVHFHNLITGYLIEYPPSEPSVLYAGRHLAHYLETISGPAAIQLSQWQFVADLARLERACIEVFHSTDAQTLEPASLQDLTPESWPGLRIRLHPAAQILDIEWQIDELMTAIREERQWEPPRRGATTIVVWRKQWQVHHRPLEPGERAALRAAAGGADFASICAILASELEASTQATELPSIINRMLAGWLRDAILTSCANPGDVSTDR